MPSDNEQHRPLAGLRLAGLFLLFFGVMLVAASALSALVVDGLCAMDGPLSAWMLEKGPAKVLRRILMLLALPGLLLLLRRAGWGGVRDSGWHADGGAGLDARWRKDLGLGVMIGLGTIACFVAVSLVSGARALDPKHHFLGEMGYVMGFAVAALVIAVLEETLARGILFRVTARVWGAWPAALVISVLFAYAHFMKPDALAFEGGTWVQRTVAVTMSTLTGYARTQDFWWRFVNITLMSVFLCFLVLRTRTVWMAAGTHAAWVWIKKLNARFADWVTDPAPPAWAAVRSDATDSPVTSLVLLVMLVCVLVMKKRPGEA